MSDFLEVDIGLEEGVPAAPGAPTPPPGANAPPPAAADLDEELPADPVFQATATLSQSTAVAVVFFFILIYLFLCTHLTLGVVFFADFAISSSFEAAIKSFVFTEENRRRLLLLLFPSLLLVLFVLLLAPYPLFTVAYRPDSLFDCIAFLYTNDVVVRTAVNIVKALAVAVPRPIFTVCRFFACVEHASLLLRQVVPTFAEFAYITSFTVVGVAWVNFIAVSLPAYAYVFLRIYYACTCLTRFVAVFRTFVTQSHVVGTSPRPP